MMVVAPFFPEVLIAWKAASIIQGHELPAKEFLDAATKFVPIFGDQIFFEKFTIPALDGYGFLSADRLGPVFGPVKGDVGGNIEKLRKQCKQHPDKKSLQQLVLHERKVSPRMDPDGAASALLWYNRYMKMLRLHCSIRGPLKMICTQGFLDCQGDAVHLCSTR